MTTIELNNEEPILFKDPTTQLYTCNRCSYYTSLKNSYIKHLRTDKHKLNVNPMECGNCNHLFHTKISFNNHMKTCVEINNEIIDDTLSDYDQLLETTSEYGDFKSIIENQELREELQKFAAFYDNLLIKYIFVILINIKDNIMIFNFGIIFALFILSR